MSAAATGNTAIRRSVVLKRRPRGEPSTSDFEIQESAIPTNAATRLRIVYWIPITL